MLPSPPSLHFTHGHKAMLPLLLSGAHQLTAQCFFEGIGYRALLDGQEQLQCQGCEACGGKSIVLFTCH